jgi:rubrerythrin
MENKIGNEVVCDFCNYTWYSRVPEPKQCPICKRYLITSKKQKEKNGLLEKSDDNIGSDSVNS